jgi:hypothetical protein
LATTRTKDLDRYLVPRDGVYYYWRRVPTKLVDADARRPLIRQSLRTDDLAEARAKRDQLEAADSSLWTALISGEEEGESAHARYKDAVRRVEAMGFVYRTSLEIARQPIEEIVQRVLSIIDARTEPVVSAVLGKSERPRDTVSQAFEIYKTEIMKAELAKKSVSQKSNWENKANRAVDGFIKLFYDMPMEDITRDEGRKLHNHWLDRVAPDDPNAKQVSASTANRAIGGMRVLYTKYFERMGQPDRQNPFAALSFRDSKDAIRPPFTTDWIEMQILRPGVLDGMNREERGIFLAMIDTGARPSEMCNLVPEDIKLDAEVPPHLHTAPI